MPLLTMKICQQIIVQGTQEKCGQNFETTYSVDTVQGMFCPLHRFCYHPIGNGLRCNNYRYIIKSVPSIYCKSHAFDRPCLNLIHKYKHLCKSTEKCFQTSFKRVTQLPFDKQIELYENIHFILKTLENCLLAREHYHNICIHPDVVDKGHSQMLSDLQQRLRKCKQILNNIKPYNDPLKTALAHIYM